jgi:hypothetical protein
MAIRTEIKGNQLIITADLETPTPSASGKTLVVCSSHGGMVTSAQVDGKPVKVNMTAWIAR